MNAEQIQQMIAAGLPCEHVHIEGDGRHWFGTIVSAQFEGLRLIQRHQLVYGTWATRWRMTKYTRCL